MSASSLETARGVGFLWAKLVIKMHLISDELPASPEGLPASRPLTRPSAKEWRAPQMHPGLAAASALGDDFRTLCAAKPQTAQPLFLGR